MHEHIAFSILPNLLSTINTGGSASLMASKENNLNERPNLFIELRSLYIALFGFKVQLDNRNMVWIKLKAL